MTRCIGTAPFMRFGSQIMAGLGIGSAIGAVQPARAQTADELVANPKKLEVIQQGCKTNQPWATEKLCREAAEAIRRRFRGEGVRYTPMKRPVRPEPNPPTGRKGVR
jgi:hypothetical protein